MVRPLTATACCPAATAWKTYSCQTDVHDRRRQVLRSLPLLQQLTLRGCPVAEREGYTDAVLRELPLVEQLDGRRVGSRAFDVI